MLLLNVIELFLLHSDLRGEPNLIFSDLLPELSNSFLESLVVNIEYLHFLVAQFRDLVYRVPKLNVI